MRKILDIVATLVIFGSIAILISWMNSDLEEEYTGRVVVIDGDSIIINAETIRLEGIDAPELNQVCVANGAKYNCGKESKSHLKSITSQGILRCKAWRRDKYERLLGICFVDGRDINAQMVLSGWAVSFGGYFTEEKQARRAGSGVWMGEFERPVDWRHQRGSMSETPSKPGENKWWKIW